MADIASTRILELQAGLPRVIPRPLSAEEEALRRLVHRVENIEKNMATNPAPQTQEESSELPDFNFTQAGVKMTFKVGTPHIFSLLVCPAPLRIPRREGVEKER